MIEELEKEIVELEEKIQEINKKIDVFDSEGRFDLSNSLFPELTNFISIKKDLEKELKFKKGPSYTDNEIDLYIDKTKAYEFHYDIYLHNQKIRVGYIEYRYQNTSSYLGDIGYGILESHRGHNYALKALKLVANKVEEIGRDSVIITTYSDNIQSIKTIEAFGGKLLGEDRNVLTYICNIKQKESIKL